MHNLPPSLLISANLLLNDLEAGGISIYPNPVAAGQQPVVNGSGIEQIEILDLTGKQVASIRQSHGPFYLPVHIPFV